MSLTAANTPRIDAEEILAGALEWVMSETPSRDGAAITRLSHKVEQQMRDVGAHIERIPGRDGFGDVLIARAPWGGDEPGILVLSHLDTVHPHGSLAGQLKPRRDGDSYYGPGIFDMKTGSFMGWYALRHLVRLGRPTPLPLTFLFVPEEEVGSPTSREHIEREGLRAKYVLVTEPTRDIGRCVTGRKGCARYVISATGRPAHAGVKHQDGRSAVKELARQILDIEAMTDYPRGISTNVGLFSGGSARNTVPAQARIEVDVRLPTLEAAAEMCGRIEALKPYDPDITLTIEGGLNRPPYEKTEATAALFEHARALSLAELGVDLEETYSGGFSDGNFTAALGTPTLDGLGPAGSGAHTEDEHILVSSLEPRTRLLVRMLETLR
jgi:glutamate carboxypeptidase